MKIDLNLIQNIIFNKKKYGLSVSDRMLTSVKFNT